MNKAVKVLFVLLTVALTVSMLSGCGVFDGVDYGKIKTEYEERTDLTVSPTSNQLIYDGEWQDRWLSIPDSRIVVNPYTNYERKIDVPQSYYCDSEKLPLNLGYLNPIDGKNIFDNAVVILANQNGILSEASSYKTSWSPHALFFEAEYGNGSKIKGKDFFYDEKTLIRSIDFEGEAPVISGNMIGLCEEYDNRLVFKGGNYIFTISFNVGFNTVFYNSYNDLKENKNGSDEHKLQLRYWKIEFNNLPENNNIVAAISIDTSRGNAEELANKTYEAANDKEIDKKFKDRIIYWNDYLKKIPIPGTFEFETIDNKGVTSKDIDRMYYTAWVLLCQCILPPSPESGFNYRQIACGKPSMWAEGDSRAPYTAAWDSIYGYHMYAYIDPEISWECLEGFMSLVDKSDNPDVYGMVAGESLPVNRARTAWMLYQMTGDKERLERIYENININLYWSMNHTYWIYHGNHGLNEGLRDPDFTSAVLVDIPYMINICNELGKSDDGELWQQRLDGFLNEFPSWHISVRNDGRKQVEIAHGEPLWTSKALYSPLLAENHDMAFYRLLESRYNKDSTFVGFRAVKLEEIMYCMYGLYDNNFSDMAKSLNESSIREVVRASAFGENYTSDPAQPRTSGVRPSLFGVVQLIDSIWIRNGYRYDSGTPKIQNFFSEGSMKNIHFGDKEFEYVLKDGRATVKGSYAGNKSIDIEANKSVGIK